MNRSGLIVAMLAAAALSGCGGAAPETVTVPVTIAAAANANPDASGRPSPVQLQIYQLKSGAALEQADYFKLSENAQAALGDSLVGSEQVVLAPGKTQTVSLKLDPATRQLGVAAGFRDIDHARWRALTPVDPERAGAVRISVGPADVSIKAGE